MAETRGVIHDLGYRRYAGPREGAGTTALSLYVTGVRHAYGLGRSGRSKVLPFLLLAINLLPAVILIGVVTTMKLDEQLLSYSAYTSQLQMVVSLFAAAQAPVLFSRDLRHRSIVLYLARPLQPATYALVRLASLWAAVLVYLVVPVLVLYVGALLAELPVWEQTVDALQALLLVFLLAGMLAGLSGVISSWSVRRGFAVVATIMVLLLGNGIVAVIQGISWDQDQDRIGEVAGLFSPYSLYRGLMELFDLPQAAITPPEGGAMLTAYVVVTLATILVCVGLLVWRFRKVADR